MSKKPQPDETEKPAAAPAPDYEALIREDLTLVMDVVAPGKGAAMADRLITNVIGFLTSPAARELAEKKLREQQE